MKLLNPEIRIETVNSCNSECTICPRDKMTRPKTRMGMEHFKELVYQAANLGAKQVSPFGFGEPLLDMDIVDKVQFITDMQMDSFITTNASLLGITKAFNLIGAGLTHIRFSVHGTGDKYEEVHRGLKWGTTRGNIMTFMKANDKKDHPVKVDISFIPMGLYTDADIQTVICGWEHAGVDGIEVWRPHSWVNAKSFRKKASKRLKTCGRPARGPIQINADGKMMVCCFDFNATMTVGDTYKDSIRDILKGKRFNEIRAQHESGDLRGLICETCDQLNEGDTPLIYSTVDEGRESGRTSSTKFRLLR